MKNCEGFCLFKSIHNWAIFCHHDEMVEKSRRGAESNQNFRSSIYASGDPIISYQIQISLASLIIQCY